jgi:outer membrane receptor protein involved in Fe transport
MLTRVFLIVPLWACPFLTWGQTGTTATILGRVTDASSAVITGARVVVHNLSTGFAREAVTEADGQFVIFSLPIGRYDVRIEAKGFRTHHTQGLALTIDQRARVDAQLTLGSLTEAITVTGEAPLTKTDDSSLSQVVTQKAITDLPLNGRNFIQLTRLMSSVNAGDATGALLNRSAGSVYGQRNSNNQFRLDGIEVTELTSNQSRLAPNIDAIQEFTVIKGIFPAEYGKVAGGTINVAVRSGTNEFHGTAFEFLRNDELNARNLFDTSGQPASLRQNQFGGVFGGPVRKNKTFFFGSYDGNQERRASVSTVRVPTAAQIAGNLSDLGAAIRDPITSLPFTGNIIPASRIHRISKALATFWPAPNNPGDPARNYVSAGSSAVGANQYLGRFDHSLSGRDQLFVRYAFASSDTKARPTYADFAARTRDASQGAVIGHTHNFSPSLLNEARFGFTRIAYNQESLVTRPNFVVEADIPGVTRDPKFADVPNVGITGFGGFGTGNSIPYYKVQNNFELVDNLMYNIGRHTLKTGFNMVRRQAQQVVPRTKKGQLTFDGNFAGSTLGDFLLGLPRQTQLGSSPYVSEAGLRMLDLFGYVQDDWRAAPWLTLNLGLRYEAVDPPTDLNGFTINFNPYTGAFTPPLAHNQQLSRPDRNNFAPRIGFALKPFHDNKTVVRGGYGVFYNANNYDEYYYMPYNPPFGNVKVYSTSGRPTITLDNPFPNEVGVTGAPTAYGVEPGLRIGYSQFFSFGVQQAIARDTTVEVSYVGSKSTRLAKGFDVNYAPPGPGTIATRRVLSADLGNAYVTFSNANATFHSLQAQLERRLSKGLLVMTSYTFGKALDDVASSGGDKGSTTIQDPRCAHSCEKGVPLYDRRQRFTFNAVYQMPFGKGRHFLNAGGVRDALLGGWDIAAITSVQSGQPLTATASGDRMNVGVSNTTRAQYLGGSVAVDNPGLNQWFNTSVFGLPALYTPGNLGRGTFTGPSSRSVDVALYKTFRIGERYRVQLRGEFFNLPNHPILGNPGLTLATNTFGVITSASGEREGQVAVKFTF